jgi:hypothetical protein
MIRIFSVIALYFVIPITYAQETFPINDIQFKKNTKIAFVNATIFKDANTAALQHGTLIVQDNKIIAVGTNIAIPSDAIVKDCKGKSLYPSFIDIYSDYGMPVIQGNSNRGFGGPAQMSSNTKYAAGWNASIKAEQNASLLFQVNEQKAKDYRANGFGVMNVHHMDGIVRGNSALVSLNTKSHNLALLNDKSSAHLSFNKGSSTQDFPGSLMGVISLLRQTFIDGEWYKNKPASEGTNLSLAAFNELQKLPMIIEGGDKWQDLRAHKIAKEFNKKFISKNIRYKRY